MARRTINQNMTKLIYISLFLAVLKVATAFEDEKTISSKFEILSPADLTGEVDHQGALFGRNPVGQSIQSHVYYTTRSLCGETPDTPQSVKKQGYILLVDRGGCSFVEKVRNAQKDNATAVLIADNTCLCSFAEFCAPDQPCEDSEPTMDDDGTGSDVRIPSMLLPKPDADKLRDELMNGTMVELKLSWPVPKATDGVSEYTLWLTPDDVVSHQFLMSFHEAAKALGNKAIFRPRMYVQDGTLKGCRIYNESDPCPGFCTNHGRYCESRSYYDFENYENKGTKMVVESLRRACIWEVYGKDGIGEEWWTYVQNWILKCNSARYSTSCAEKLFTDASIDGNKIEQCMLETGNFREDTTNTLLDLFLDEAEDDDVTFASTWFVNGAVMRGSLTYGSVLEAICTTYEEDDTPDICSQWKACSSQCASDSTCVLHGEECVEYHVFDFIYNGTQYDDDYVNPLAPDDETEYDDDYADPYDSVETPTEQTDTLTESPVQTEAPVQPPTNSPLPSPTSAPISQSSPDSKKPPTGQTHEDAQVVETIQIYEEESGTSGFIAGLTAGILGALLFGVAILLVLRDRRRNEDMRPLIRPSLYDASDLFLDDESYDSSEGFTHKYDRHLARSKRNRPRKAVKRDRARTFRNDKRSLREYDDEEAFHSRYNDDTLPSRSQGKNSHRAKKTNRSLNSSRYSVRFKDDTEEDIIHSRHISGDRSYVRSKKSSKGDDDEGQLL